MSARFVSTYTIITTYDCPTLHIFKAFLHIVPFDLQQPTSASQNDYFSCCFEDGERNANA